MRIPTIAGVALIIVAAYLFFGGGITSQRNVLDVGGLTVTAEERHPVQPWIAGLVLLAGAALLVTDSRRGKA
jgi:hypothetical protein